MPLKIRFSGIVKSVVILHKNANLAVFIAFLRCNNFVIRCHTSALKCFGVLLNFSLGIARSLSHLRVTKFAFLRFFRVFRCLTIQVVMNLYLFCYKIITRYFMIVNIVKPKFNKKITFRAFSGFILV